MKGSFGFVLTIKIASFIQKIPDFLKMLVAFMERVLWFYLE